MSRDLSSHIARLKDAVVGLEMQVTLSGARRFLSLADLDGVIVIGDEEPDFAVIAEALACDAVPNDNPGDAIADAHWSARLADCDSNGRFLDDNDYALLSQGRAL